MISSADIISANKTLNHVKKLNSKILKTDTKNFNIAKNTIKGLFDIDGDLGDMTEFFDSTFPNPPYNEMKRRIMCKVVQKKGEEDEIDTEECKDRRNNYKKQELKTSFIDKDDVVEKCKEVQKKVDWKVFVNGIKEGVSFDLFTDTKKVVQDMYQPMKLFNDYCMNDAQKFFAENIDAELKKAHDEFYRMNIMTNDNHYFEEEEVKKIKELQANPKKTMRNHK
jgi:hypothetical protein